LLCSKCGKETIGNAAFCVGCGAELTGKRPAKDAPLILAAGILDTVAGGLCILSFVFMAIVLFVVDRGNDVQLVNVTLILPGVMVIGGAVAVLAGIILLRRKNRAAAIAGAAGATLTLSPFGVAALVVTVMARNEFE
jgi:hypothetical protein